MKPLRIVFIGTPEFAVYSLEAMLQAGFHIVAVITAPDKPAGRNMQLQASAVKLCALKHHLPVLQPTNLKDPTFVETLRSYQADLQVVIAFRMMPEVVWNMPRLGTMNLHASLLPDYRGAAPINHAIIQGEKVTGVSTFLLKHEIDTGDLLQQEQVAIEETDDAGTLHDKLMKIGADLVVKSVHMIEKGNYTPIPQTALRPLKSAPKITKEFCEIDWNKPAEIIQNFVRGLSPYPAARCRFNGKVLKVFAVEILDTKNLKPGEMSVESGRMLNFGSSDCDVSLTDVQLEGRKRMPAEAFIRGL